jgi:hypothetical protein
MTVKTSHQVSGFSGVVNALRNQAIRFRGPFCTRKGRIVYCLEDQIVLESELLDLLAAGQLNPIGVSSLLHKLRAH